MRDSVPSASYSSVCNVLRQWNISLIPTYRVYGLYDKKEKQKEPAKKETIKQQGHVTLSTELQFTALMFNFLAASMT